MKEWWMKNDEGWMKNGEGWKMNDEGWWFQAVEGFWWLTDRKTDRLTNGQGWKVKLQIVQNTNEFLEKSFYRFV